jgi:midasin (ATPase involved in ribosome maturation)
MSTISEVQRSLTKIIANKVKHSVFLWGPPGIGKSSIMRKVANDSQLEYIDLRVSQLAPTDLRGLPFIEDGQARFAPPSFLPTEGRGILAIDEFNMASPAMMGIAQQLILDRRVGDYVVPEDWFIVAAGNRAKDRAAVSQMPAPVANRFIHFNVESDLTSFKQYALLKGLNEQIISFLNFRPELLFDFNKNATAWPSPRSWEFANTLLSIDLEIDAAIGEGASAEFYAYQSIYSRLPDVDAILQGEKIDVPREPSLMYAVCGALVSRAKTAQEFFNASKWLIGGTTEDYIGLFMGDAMVALKIANLQGGFVKLVARDPQIKAFITKYQELLK